MTTIPETRAIEHIRRFEAQYNTFQYQIDGWCVWQTVRGALYYSLVYASHTNWSPSKTLQRWLESSLLILKEIPVFVFGRRARYLVKAASTARRELENGSYKDIYFDDFLHNSGTHFKIEYLNSKEFYARNKNALIKSDITTSLIDVLAGFLALIRLPVDIKRMANKLGADITEEFDTSAFPPKRLEMIIGFFYWEMKLYGWLFRRVRPDYVLLTNYVDLAMVAAARSQHIKVVEYSHGMFNRYHPGALNETAIPYRSSVIVPHRIFVFGEAWKQEQALNGFFADEVRPVGSAQMDFHRKRRADFIKTQEDAGVCTIVLTTSGFTTGSLIDFIAEFLSLAEDRLPYQLIIKLHPGYEPSKAPYETAFSNNPRVTVLLGAEGESTFELLTRADFHMSINSSCHFDALGLAFQRSSCRSKIMRLSCSPILQVMLFWGATRGVCLKSYWKTGNLSASRLKSANSITNLMLWKTSGEKWRHCKRNE